MADIVTSKSVSITEIMNNLDRYKYNPIGVQRVVLDLLDEISNGEVDIVDATNPVVFTLESSAVNTAYAIQENVINLRKQYSSLAQTEDDLYMHLSDQDFLNRFAVPSETEFTIAVLVNDIYTKLPYDESEKCYKATLARDSEFRIEELTFTLQYPIHIRRFDNGVVQISYDTEIASPLQTLTSNIIDYTVRNDADNTSWLFFKIPVKQIAIASSYQPVQKSTVFSYSFPYNDNYYYCRVFYRNSQTVNNWVEVKTTHSDQVFDPFIPTALLKVISGLLTVSIPAIYLNSELISGEVRIDIYTTKGELTINLSNYKITSFQTHLKAINEERDIDIYTNAMSDISFYSYSDTIVSGGSKGLDFKTLRDRVINNSLGDRKLPITNVQLEAHVNDKGFDLVKNTDVVTNRIFLATKKLPKPLNTRLLTSANIGISTVLFNTDELRSMSGVKDNDSRLTIMSDNLYLNNNGKISLLSSAELETLKILPKMSMVETLNNHQYLYTPFYYVLDNSKSEFEVRAYNLDYPIANNLSFIAQNQSLQLPVNTAKYLLEKISIGYRLTIVTKSGKFYKDLGDNQVHAQIGFYPHGEKHLAYINGIQIGKTDEGERIYGFDIETNYDIDSDNRICITNTKMFTNEIVEVWTDLTNTFHIFYSTTSITDEHLPDTSDALLGKFILPNTSAAVTHESLVLSFGNVLKNLWTRSRTFASGLEYDRYTVDVPMIYEQDVYATDPVTGSIFSFDEQTGDIIYLLEHSYGDPVLDNLGNAVYKHRAGDVVLDETGKPVTKTVLHASKELDMLFVDGKYYFITDEAYLNYRNEIVAILDSWITRDLSTVQDILLEKTKIFFYPQTTLGLVKVYPDSTSEDYIASEQTINVKLYVKKAVYEDETIRKELENITAKTLDSHIGNIVVNMDSISDALKAVYGNTVEAVALSNLGGERNYDIVTLANEHNRLCLKKKLVQQPDGKIIIKEDVNVSFYNIEKQLAVN